MTYGIGIHSYGQITYFLAPSLLLLLGLATLFRNFLLLAVFLWRSFLAGALRSLLLRAFRPFLLFTPNLLLHNFFRRRQSWRR